jgi:hypothetical protein
VSTGTIVLYKHKVEMIRHVFEHRNRAWRYPKLKNMSTETSILAHTCLQRTDTAASHSRTSFMVEKRSNPGAGSYARKPRRQHDAQCSVANPTYLARFGVPVTFLGN